MFYLKVIIDTNIFVKKNFDFNNPSFENLSVQITNGDVKLYNTSILQNEIIANIKKKVTSTKSALDNLKKQYILKNTDIFGTLLTKISEEGILKKVEREIIDNYIEFLSNNNVSNIEISSVDIDKVFDMYFNEHAPFEEKKKAEFPDAFNLLSLVEWCNRKDDNIYIISDDEGVKKFCDNNPLSGLKHLTSLDSLSDLVLSEKEAYKYEYVQRVIKTYDDEISDRLVEELTEYRDFEFAFSEGTIEDISVTDLIINHFDIVELTEDGAKINFNVEAQYDGRFYILTEHNVYYLPDDLMLDEYTEHRYSEKISLKIEALVSDLDFIEGNEGEYYLYPLKVNENQPIRLII